MNDANHAYDHQVSSSSLPLKRRRGRPRKYPRPDGSYEHSVRVTPNQHAHYNANNSSNDNLIGQLVHGFVDGSFDAGYLLTVKVGNSDATFKGAVFKPGAYVPLSADNDIAPGVPMIKRSEIPFPTEITETPKKIDACHDANKEESVGVHQENGATSSKQEVQIQKESNIPDATVALTQIHSENQIKTPSTNLESTILEEIRGDVGTATEDKVSASVDAIPVDLLEAVQPEFSVPYAPVSASASVENYGPGKMAELLQVVQDNAAKEQEFHSDDHFAGSDQS